MIYDIEKLEEYYFLYSFRKVSRSICACLRMEERVPCAMGLLCTAIVIFLPSEWMSLA